MVLQPLPALLVLAVKKAAGSAAAMAEGKAVVERGAEKVVLVVLVVEVEV